MEVPYYVLRANEGVRVPKNDSLVLYYLKKMIWWIIVLLIVCSFIFRDNLFLNVNIGVLGLLICVYLYIKILTKEVFVPSPFEIRFYADFMIIYREKYYYHTKLSRKQYDKFFYKDIHNCLYKKTSHRISIFGIVEGVWYDYKKDGTISNQPTYHKTVDSICYFYTNMAPDVDFVVELETHAPIKVIIQDN